VRTVRLQVTLREVTPAVLRVVDVPASCTLSELHDLLQVAMGWTDSHLHQFLAGDACYGVPDQEFDTDERDEAGFRLADLPTRFGYLYDFGDGWTHDIEVLGPGEAQPGCGYGEGRCPPEDCGGPTGYAELVEVLADPTHDDHEHMRSWVGEWPEFDQAATDRVVRDMVGQVPPSVALLLGLIGDRVKLTPGGRLPRVLVRQVQQQRPDWYPLDRPAQVEDDLPPLAALHELLRHVGLLRLSKGVLYRTRVAGDPLEVVRRLRSW
jgi:pRiA4b ORF-3-like protein